MAGSLKWFNYETDDGDRFGILMDESNGEAVGNQDFVVGDYLVVKYSVPRNIEPRHAIYRTQDGTRSVKIPLTNPAASLANVPEQILIYDGTTNANLTRLVGEVVSPIPIHIDTGLNDGDIN